MKITIQALGALKKYLPREKEFELTEESNTLKELISEQAGIPASETRLCFIVNGSIQKESYTLQPNDKVVVLRMGGAG